MKRISLVLMFLLFVGVTAWASTENSIVRIETSKGDIIIELFNKKAPKTVENFLAYIEEGFYDGVVFHRVIKGFVVQGGGFEPGLKQRIPTRKPIINEANNKLENIRGTIAMARTPVVNSATSQFFINLADNHYLNYRNSSPQGYGYAVFGKIIGGMSVVEKISEVKTTRVGEYYMDVPKQDILINRVTVLRKKDKKK